MKKILHGLVVACAFSSALVCAATPDFNGVWQVVRYETQLRTTDGKAPPLLLAMAARHQQTLAAYGKGDVSFDPTAHQCASPGTPRAIFLPYPFEIIQTPQQVTFLFEWNHLFRSAPLGRRNEYPYTTAMGASQATLDGNTLVIDTNNLADTTFLDATGLPHSEALKVTERYTLAADGRKLSVTVRFEDPQAFTQPWETTLQLRKLPGYRLTEDVCLDRQLRGEPPIKR